MDEAWELEQREVVLQEVCELHKIDFIFQSLSDVSGLVIVRPPYLCCSVCKHEVLKSLNCARIELLFHYMHILHTVLYTFTEVLTRRICLSIESFLKSQWPFTSMFDSGVIFLRRN